MVDVSDAPIGSPLWNGPVRMGDPVVYAADPRFVTVVYPYPQNAGPTTYASWKVGASEWSSSETIGAEEIFALNQMDAIKDTPGNGRCCVLHAERAGPLDWLMVTGLF